MEFLSGINFELIAQLTMLAMIVIAGPVIVFLLFLRGGDLQAVSGRMDADMHLQAPDSDIDASVALAARSGFNSRVEALSFGKARLIKPF